MAEELRLEHFGKILGHHVLIAGEPAAGQDQRLAAQVFRNCRPDAWQRRTGNMPVGVGEEVGDTRIREQVHARAGAGIQQAAHQFRAGAVGATVQVA